MTNCEIRTAAGWMIHVFVTWNCGQAGPWTVSDAGRLATPLSGFPQLHLTTGAPNWSSRTAVPACSTDSTPTARPSL
jgi:hypothetical protein